MRIAYADPPYIGQAKRLYGEQAKEVNHRLLIAHLEEFDGWALSASSNSLPVILPLCPKGVRVAAWVRKSPMIMHCVSPVYAWEPVIFRPIRKRPVHGYLFDWLACDPDNGFLAPSRHIIGRKPQAFCFWVFELIKALPSDELTDIFPGSGAVGRAWDTWGQQRSLWNVDSHAPAQRSKKRISDKLAI